MKKIMIREMETGIFRSTFPKIIILILGLHCSVYQSKSQNSISDFSLFVNPAGFVQFGPILGAEIGIKENAVLNIHTRFSSLGVLSYVVNSDPDGLDRLSGMAVGGGPIYFLGSRLNKPYIGALLEFEHLKLLYAGEDPWEWEELSNSLIIAFNGGYRFRFESGFFINTGAYLGASAGRWKYSYVDPSYTDNSEHTGTEVMVFGMVEVSIGIEF